MTTAAVSEQENNLLPGVENMLIKGVSSEGLLRWAICNLRPVGPGTPPWGGCCSMVDGLHVECEGAGSGCGQAWVVDEPKLVKEGI